MQAIVVLGAKVHEGGRPSGALLARVERAVELFQQGKGEVIVFSGGGSAQRSEAEVARGLAVRAGVPERACVCEEKSRNTEENAKFTAEILRGLGITRVWLVTDGFHLARAQRHFWRQGIATIAAPARWRGRKSRWFAWWLREAFALARRPSLWWARPPVDGARDQS